MDELGRLEECISRLVVQKVRFPSFKDPLIERIIEASFTGEKLLLTASERTKLRGWWEKLNLALVKNGETPVDLLEDGCLLEATRIMVTALLKHAL